MESRFGVDAFDAAGILSGDYVVVVGAFVPFLLTLKQVGQTFTILEINPRTLKADGCRGWAPVSRPAAYLRRCWRSPAISGWRFEGYWMGVIPAGEMLDAGATRRRARELYLALKAPLSTSLDLQAP